MVDMWPSLAVLELLVQIADGGSLSGGARALGIAQPNASRAIRQFEQSRGLRILDRSPRGSTLTADGLALVEGARAVISALRTFDAAADALHSARTSRLKVGASLTIGEYLIPIWLVEIRRRDPDLTVALQIQNSNEVLSSLGHGELDVGFIETPTVPAGLRSTIVATDRLAVVVNPSHPWARRRAITVDELAATPLVVREAGSGTRRTLDAALATYSMAEPALELKSNSAVRVSVSAGAGPAVLSELAVAAWVTAGELTLVPVEGIRLERKLRAVWKGPNPLEDPAAELVRIARATSQARSLSTRHP